MFPTFHNVWIAIYNILRYVTFNPVFWLEDTMRKIISERKVKQVRKKIMNDMRLVSYFKTVFMKSRKYYRFHI